MDDAALQRRRMVERQVEWRGIHDTAVLRALADVPREDFVPEDLRHAAYFDEPLPIGGGQTISQPFIVALMAALARIKPRDRVLEVGTGSGYAAAVLSRIAAKVVSLERDPELGEAARDRLGRGGYDNVTVQVTDGSLGWPPCRPYDAILVAAGGPAVPAALKDQLAPDGRLVMPVGEHRNRQRLVTIVRTTYGFHEDPGGGPVQFVPLVGAAGWAA